MLKGEVMPSTVVKDIGTEMSEQCDSQDKAFIGEFV